MMPSASWMPGSALILMLGYVLVIANSVARADGLLLLGFKNEALKPLIGKPKKAIYPVVVVGYMANNLIPVRIGELLRSYYLSLREPVSAAGAFGTVAVERASDVLALLFFLAAAWAFLPATGAFGDFVDEVPGGAPVLAMVALVPFLGVLGVVVVITVLSRDTILRFVARVVSPLLEKFQQRALRLAASPMSSTVWIAVSNPCRANFCWSLAYLFCGAIDLASA